MDISQLSSLATLLHAGLSKTKSPVDDLTNADWSVLRPYLVENELLPIVGTAFKAFPEYLEAAGPQGKELLKQSIEYGLEMLPLERTIMKLASEWRKENKVMLVVGGMVNAKNYPSPKVRGGHTVVCTALATDKAKDAAGKFGVEEYDLDKLHVCVLSTLVPQGDDEASVHVAKVLEESFFSAPCLVYNAFAVMPNNQFSILYLLNAAYSQFTEGTMDVRVVIDWAMLLRRIGLQDEEFDWNALQEKIEALGYTNFAQVLTSAALRLTGVTLCEGAQKVKGEAPDSDVEILLGYALEPSKPSITSRWSKFTSILRNHKKYSKVMGVSPVSAAFRALFK